MTPICPDFPTPDRDSALGRNLWRGLFLSVILAVLCLSTAALAADSSTTVSLEKTSVATELIPRDILFGNPIRSNVQLSPDGRSISYLAAVDGVLNVWVGPSSDPAAARPITKDSYRGIRIYFWTFSNRHIVYLQDRGGDENWRAYSVDVENGKEVDLTPIEGVRAQIQGVSRQHPGQILVGLNDRDPRLHDIYRIDLETGERVLVEENIGVIGYLTDQSFQVRLSATIDPTGAMKLNTRKDDGWEPLIEIAPEDNLTTAPLGFDKTGEHFYLLDTRGRDTAALTRVAVKNGEFEVLATDSHSDIGGVLTHPTEYHVQAYRTNFERTQWHVLDKAVARDLEALAKLAGDGEFRVGSRTDDDRTWMVTIFDDDGPTRYYLYDRRSKTSRYLFSNRPALEDLPLAKMYPRVIESRDGLELVSYLSLPPWLDRDGDGRPSEPLPMVLLVHGGPWARDSWGYNSRHQWLANRGYAVLSVNYRGSTGFGKEFLNAANLEWSAKMHDDLVDVVQWAIEHEIADPNVKVPNGHRAVSGEDTLSGL